MLKSLITATSLMFMISACGSYQSSTDGQSIFNSEDDTAIDPNIPVNPTDPGKGPIVQLPKQKEIPIDYNYSAKSEELAVFGLGKQKEIIVNGQKQTKVIKKAKLSDKGLKLDEAVKAALKKKGLNG